MKLFRNLSPEARFVIAETARVCVCVGLIIFAASAGDKLAQRVLGPSPPPM